MKRFSAVIFMLCIALLMSFLVAPTAEAAKKKTSKKTKTQPGTVFSVDDEYAIESDISVQGCGDGYHVKLVLIAPHERGVSFGIQYDVDAAPPYNNRLALLFENIYSNKHEPGEQVYHRPLDVQLEYGKTYHLMLTMDKRGVASAYFDHQKVATYRNKKMAHKVLAPQVEVSGKHNGDRVIADFKNIHVKDGIVNTVEAFLAHPIDETKRIKSKIHSNKHVTFSGVLTGLNEGEDWDSAYDRVSSIVRYSFE